MSLCQTERMIIRNISLFLLTLIIVSPAFAVDPELSWYLFENRGRARSGKMLLEDKNNPVKVPADWFDWNCLVQKQKDGVLMECRRGNEFVETKVYCDLPQSRFGRLVRLGKGDNFVTFEARCSTKVPSKKFSPKKKLVPKKTVTQPTLPPIAPAINPPPEFSKPTPAVPEPPESPVAPAKELAPQTDSATSPLAPQTPPATSDTPGK